MSTISIKVENQQQADKFAQIFKNIGFRCSKDQGEVTAWSKHFNINADKLDDPYCWMGSNWGEKKTWREFVLAYLENRYVVVDSEEKLFLMDFFNIRGLHDVTKEERAKDLKYRMLYFNDPVRFWPREYDENKKEISFSKVELLLNSITENEMPKSDQEITTKFKPEELALITAIVGCTPHRETKSHIEEFCHYKGIDKDQLNKFNITSVYRKLEKLVENNENLLAPPKIKEFIFSCGLKTETKVRQITIGCQTKSFGDWLDYVNNIIELKLDIVTVDEYSFERSEIIEFRDWLKENFSL